MTTTLSGNGLTCACGKDGVIYKEERYFCTDCYKQRVEKERKNNA